MKKTAICALLILSTVIFSPSVAIAARKPAAPGKFTITKPLKIPVAPVERVSGHITKTGKVVKPFYRTVPDKTKSNNFSTKGNINPFTGKKGTK